MRVLVEGLGAVGARAVRLLAESPEVRRVLAAGSTERRRRAVASSGGPKVRAVDLDHDEPRKVDVVVLAVPSAAAAAAATRHLRAGRAVVTTADGFDATRGLLELAPEAEARGLPVVVGAGFSPGMSCLLARHGSAPFDVIDEIHVARTGTGGPACARQHHRALSGTALDWHDGGWRRRRSGTGRQLCWFPDPIGARDCYAAALPDALLLTSAFPEAARVTARLAATRRDRVTARLPMLRRPHPEGLVGALRVELWGRTGATRRAVVLGALDRPAVASAAVAVTAAQWVAGGRVPPGAGGLAAVEDPAAFLSDLAHLGVKAAVFEGAT